MIENILLEQQPKSDKMPIDIPSAQMPQNPMLSDAMSNMLIAKFMGVKIVKRNNEDAVYMFENAAFPEYFRCTKFNTYHTDWNMLMPVIYKIEKLEREDNANFNKYQLILSYPIYTEIKIIWVAVLKFIEWYNKHSVSEGIR